MLREGELQWDHQCVTVRYSLLGLKVAKRGPFVPGPSSLRSLGCSRANSSQSFQFLSPRGFPESKCCRRSLEVILVGGCLARRRGPSSSFQRSSAPGLRKRSARARMWARDEVGPSPGEAVGSEPGRRDARISERRRAR
uniref:Uncharacterized protein n=1 Tax=Arundo donax TaxID=35708 RepID=A0A0A9E028_ARUDO